MGGSPGRKGGRGVGSNLKKCGGGVSPLQNSIEWGGRGYPPLLFALNRIPWSLYGKILRIIGDDSIRLILDPSVEVDSGTEAWTVV